MANPLQQAGAKLREWRENPITFVREVFQVEPDAWQAEVLNAFVTNDRLALKACKGPGKSCVMAWVGWNFLLCYLHPKVVGTSITGQNLKDGLWTEFAKWQQKSELLKRAFSWSSERIVCNDHPETWWASARAWPKGADANQQADTLAGIHADNVLFLVDEAGGIPDAVVAAAEAGLANASKEEGRVAKLFLSGNPTHLEGPLYRACTSERHLWWVKEISSDPDAPDRTPRVSKEWAQIQIDKYGRDNPWVLVNVFGQFPPGQDNTLIGRGLAMEASRRTITQAEYIYAPKILGVDVARFGDDRSVITLRQGKVSFPPRVYRHLDTMELAGEVGAVIAHIKPQVVFVDQAGVGAGVVDRLRELRYPVVGIEAGSRATDQRYFNLRAQMWGRMADWYKSGACTPNDGELVSEVSSPTYKFSSNGKLQLESKDDLKKRGLPSPDKGDSLALTFSMPVGVMANPEPGSLAALTEELKSPNFDYDPYKEWR